MRLHFYVCSLPDCGKSIARVRHAKHCSVSCRQKAYRRARRRVVPCEECGGDIHTSRKDRRWCSALCADAAARKARAAKPRPGRRKGPTAHGESRRWALRCKDCRSVLDPGEIEFCAACTPGRRDANRVGVATSGP